MGLRQLNLYDARHCQQHEDHHFLLQDQLLQYLLGRTQYSRLLRNLHRLITHSDLIKSVWDVTHAGGGSLDILLDSAVHIHVCAC